MDGTKWSFTALDVNSVVINPISHIFAGAAGGVFRSMNDADQWSDVSSGLLPPGGNVWAVATGGLPPEDLPVPVLLAAVYFTASDPLPRRGSFRDQGLAQRRHRDPESLAIQKRQHVRLVGLSSATFRRGE